jgi:hypothetical protein
VPIDPIELKLEERTFETARLHGMFGALRDASPDYWGRRRRLAEGMREAGANVVTPFDAELVGATDESWLSAIGPGGWLALI